MTYFEIFDYVKNKLGGADVSNCDSHMAFEFVVTGEGEGKFYAEIKDKQLFIEPYDYHDCDARFIASAETFIAIVDGKILAEAAFTLSRLKVEGNLEKALELGKIMNANAEKANKENTAAQEEAKEEKTEETIEETVNEEEQNEEKDEETEAEAEPEAEPEAETEPEIPEETVSHETPKKAICKKNKKRSK